MDLMMWKYISLLVCISNMLIIPNCNVEGAQIPLTLVKDAVAKGAVCLDGSPPAYHFSPGSGSGANSWLVHMEGGGWCEDVTECAARKSNFRGSSTKMTSLSFSGILGSQQQSNPDFYNWNRVKVRYCDGSSFTGDVESVDPATNLHYRGARVWQAIMDELLAKGMKSAQNALLSGCSAGGLASILHCDHFRSLLPRARVKCFSDAGYFIDAKDIAGVQSIRNFFGKVVALHGSAKHLPPSCTSRMTPNLCFFPQYVAQSMQTPLFLLNTAYDTWQIKNILAPKAADRGDNWKNCKLDIKKCSSAQLQTLQGYRTQFLSSLPRSSSSTGMFIDSCFAHCQSGSQATWLNEGSPVIGNTAIGKAVGDWYYNRNNIISHIDCAYPCNKSCQNGADDD